jgi:hypothetical protein
VKKNITLGKKVLQWYQENKRDLPWRHTKDAYKVWVSEVMLQQTQTSRVIDYYSRFLKKFPTVESKLGRFFAFLERIGVLCAGKEYVENRKDYR